MTTGLCFSAGERIGRSNSALTAAIYALSEGRYDPKLSVEALKDASLALRVLSDLEFVFKKRGKARAQADAIAEDLSTLAQALESKKKVKNAAERVWHLKTRVLKLRERLRKRCGYAQEHKP